MVDGSGGQPALTSGSTDEQIWFPDTGIPSTGCSLGAGRCVLTSASAALLAAWGSAGPSQEWAGKPVRAPAAGAGSPVGSL